MTEKSPALPAPIWAKILSTYCAYEDVRSCLATSKLLWNDVPPVVERLYVFKASELHPRYASKFANLKRAYIYSLTSLPSTGEGGSEGSPLDDSEDECDGFPKTSLCLDTARNVVRFLVCFPKLEVAHVGGYAPAHARLTYEDRTRLDLPYAFTNCDTEGHHEAFRGMLRDFCGAFEAGSLDADSLQLAGILVEPRQMECGYEYAPSRSRDSACDLCPRICQTFPLSVISHHDYRLNCCQSEKECLLKVFQRDSSYINQSGILTAELVHYCARVSVNVILPPARSKNILSIVSGKVLFRMAIQLSESNFERIDFLCKSCGADPTVADMTPFIALPRARWMDSTHPLEFERNRNYISRESFDRLTKFGFKIRESDFIIILPIPGEERSWRLDPCEEQKLAESFTTSGHKRNRERDSFDDLQA